MYRRIFIIVNMTKQEIKIRTANVDDAERLLSIYAPYVEKTAISFEYKVPSIGEFKRRIATFGSQHSYIVALSGEEIVGYAYATQLGEREAFKYSVELAIYVSKDHRGGGIGRKLYDDMQNRLIARGIKNMYACVAYTETEDEYLTNSSSRFHEHLGFKRVAHFHSCGYKFDKWYDIVWYEKTL